MLFYSNELLFDNKTMEKVEMANNNNNNDNEILIKREPLVLPELDALYIKNKKEKRLEQ